MVDNYKKAEELHYDQKVQNKTRSDFSYSDYVLKGCTNFYYSQIDKQISESHKYKILDYGCGKGDKHFQFAKGNNHIVGIDISAKSVEFANMKTQEQGFNGEYLVMDCENMTFPSDTFDLIFDFGTFSSLNINLAINELCRVIKKDGTLICIETYGHYPFMKIKRQLNVFLANGLTGRPSIL
jgi:ubiquinone/menaquinone biosynthesis C-methylase UbiE